MGVRRAVPLILPGLEGLEPPARGPNKREEAELQKSLVDALRKILPREFIVHGSNHEVREGGRDAAIKQGIAKAMGATTGHSDLVIYGHGRCLFMELKAKGGRLEKPQAEFRDRVQALGHAWALVRCYEDAVGALNDAGIPTRLAGLGNARWSKPLPGPRA